MSRLLDVIATTVTERLPVEEERELIEDAQRGDEPATVALLGMYATMIRSRTRTYRDREEVRQIAILAFLEAVHDFDPVRHEGGLGGLLRSYLSRDLAAVERPSIVSRRSWQRYLHIMRVVDQDVERGLVICSEYLMTEDTFWQIYLASQGAIGEDPVIVAPDNYEDLEDKVLAERALGALDPFERTVVELIYGFHEEPKSSAEVVYTLSVEAFGEDAADDGQTICNSSTIRRTHARALEKMRARIGADNE